MASFISRFSSSGLVRVLAFGGIALMLGIVYSVACNPEVLFLVEAHKRKTEWANQVDQAAADGPRFVVCGGSNVLVGIHPAQCLQDDGIKVLNAGLAAGMGAELLVKYGLQQLRKGDVLIISLEPSLMLRELREESLGVQFAFASREGQLLESSGISGSLSRLNKLRPGARHLMTLVAKIALGRPLHRYSVDELQLDGSQIIRYEDPVTTAPPLEGSLNETGRELFKFVKQRVLELECSVFYLPPMGFCPEAQESEYRRLLAAYFLSVSEFIPVLKDEALGINTRPDDFVDSWWHLNENAATVRTRSVCNLLNKREAFTSRELELMTNEP